MSFSNKLLFVVPVGNTLPTTGSTQALTPGQFGIYRDNAGTDIPLAATAANAGSAKWLQIFQGNHVNIPGQSSKRSDRIFLKNIREWYKVPALTTKTPQITTVTNLQMVAGDIINLTLRVFSNDIEDAYWNGLTRTVSVMAECLDCGDSPCESKVTDATYTSLRDAVNNEPLLGKYITATVTGTVSGSDATLVLTAKTLVDPFSQVTSADPHNNPFRQDRIMFYTYINKGMDVSQDFESVDRCDIAGTVTTTQRGSYAHGLAAEIKQMEVWYFSQSSVYPELFESPEYNPAFTSQVTANDYTLYYIKFQEPAEISYSDVVRMDESAIIAVPTGETTTIEAILVAFAGAVKDETASGAISYSPLTP